MPYGYKVENGDGKKYKYEDVEVELNNEKLYLENSTKIFVYEQLRDDSQLIFTDVLIKVFNEDFKMLKVKIYVKNITNIQTSDKNINDLIIVKKDGTMNLISFSTKNSQLVLKNEITNLLKLGQFIDI